MNTDGLAWLMQMVLTAQHKAPSTVLISLLLMIVMMFSIAGTRADENAYYCRNNKFTYYLITLEKAYAIPIPEGAERSSREKMENPVYR